ncbi:hypothetical protein [Paractinoplanes durhamensis]|uniref:hypothetical protein n=1 Tax=Paractinoplanes durhamensis TaxID=113563 RepID=UPI00363D866D
MSDPRDSLRRLVEEELSPLGSHRRRACAAAPDAAAGPAPSPSRWSWSLWPVPLFP